MKNIFKVLGYSILLILVLLLAAVGYVSFFLPNVGDAPDIQVALTHERVQRGEYLANTVAVCMDCHSKRDWSQFSGPIVEGTNGGGGEVFDQKLGFPGVFYSKNITPYGLKDWTDGEIYRAITSGVNKDGKALMPVMPYHYYGQVDTEDVYSIIAYLRTLPEVRNDVAESKADFPFSVILNTIPHEPKHTTKPSPHDTVAYGGYLVNMSGCVECHTKFEKGQLVAGTEFGGGREFLLPFGMLRTPNITFDNTTGIGAWTQEQFVSRFKMYADSNYHGQKTGESDFNTIMPWMMYSHMNESDIASIYQYLKTVKPISNKVEKFVAKGQLASAK